MLGRLASDLNVLAHAPWLDWTCCWQHFDHTSYLGTVEHWQWRFCNGGMPGEPYGTWDKPNRPCGHWHHSQEFPPMATVAIPSRR
jgi:hypothetical protein